MAKAISSPQKESFLLLQMQYGDPDSPSYARYTNRSDAWSNFAPTPALDIELPKNDGLFSEDLCTIKLPADAFVDRFTDGLPTSPCFVTVQEVTLPAVIGEAATILTLFTGKVKSTIKNKDGRSGNRVFKAQSWKKYFGVKLGLPCDHQCPFIFNGLGCNSGTFSGGGPNPLGSSPSRHIASIDGHKVTLTVGLSPSRANLYNKGFVSKDGINIDIREFNGDTDDTVLYLTRQPPTDWLGALIVINPGCDKTIENCRDWNNEANFGGIGFGIPAYNPNIEDSPL